MTRGSLLALLVALTACATEPDTLADPQTGCGGEACTSDDGIADASSSDAPDSSGASDPSGASDSSGGSNSSGASDPSDSSDPGDASDASGTTDEPPPDDDGSSTGEPHDDNGYGPCVHDEDCDSGTCYYGMCTVPCWTPEDGATPCPPPDGAADVTVICAAIGVPIQNYCDICLDCVQYCIAICTSEQSVCPAGGQCVTDLCLADGPYCGAAIGEYDDASCDDGLDNDDDGFTDCDDFDCTSDPWVTVCGPGENTDEACSNGLDDDDDGFTDCADFNCSANLGVTACG